VYVGVGAYSVFYPHKLILDMRVRGHWLNYTILAAILPTLLDVAGVISFIGGIPYQQCCQRTLYKPL